MLSEYIVCHINLGNVFKSMMRLEHIYVTSELCKLKAVAFMQQWTGVYIVTFTLSL